MKPSSRTTMLLAACCLVLSLSACSVYNPVADFIGARYTNVISYFNTYYNAQRAFSEAEAEVMTARRSALIKNPQSIQAYPVSSTARQKFNTAIEKGSKLLSYYPTCKWVDNTLLMIGKSYFYLDDDLKAERKFVELLAKFPESSVIPEVELLYGRSLLRQKKIADGLQRLNDLVDRSAQIGNDFAGEAAFTIGAYYYGIPDYLNAAKYFDRASDLLSDDDAKAQSQLFAGLCSDQLGDYVKAEKMFRNSRKSASEYNQMFEGELQATRMQMKQKHYDAALRNLTAYLRDAKNSEFYGRIHLLIGQIALEEERYEDAVAKFTFIDTTFARTDEAAHSYYALAKYHENIRSDYALARVNYEKAKTEFSSSEVVDESIRKADVLGRYFQIVRNTARYDSLIADMLVPTPDTVKTDTLGKKVTADSPAKSAAAVLTPAVLDSLRTDSLKTVDRWNAKLDSLRRMRVKSHQELAGLFYLEIARPDSALYWYNRVVAEDGSGENTPRSLFVMADLYRLSGHADSLTVDTLYARILSDFPASPYAQEVRKLRGIPLLQPERDLAKDLYRSAEQSIEDGAKDSALSKLSILQEKFPRSSYAPKALYTTGWLYENDPARRDSASAAYRRLAAKYPLTLYAQKVQPLIAAEDQLRLEEEQALKKAAADSLAAMKSKADSIAAANPKPDSLSGGTSRADTVSVAVKKPAESVPPAVMPDKRDSTSAPSALPADSTRKNPFILSPRQERAKKK